MTPNIAEILNWNNLTKTIVVLSAEAAHVSSEGGSDEAGSVLAGNP